MIRRHHGWTCIEQRRLMSLRHKSHSELFAHSRSTPCTPLIVTCTTRNLNRLDIGVHEPGELEKSIRLIQRKVEEMLNPTNEAQGSQAPTSNQDLKAHVEKLLKRQDLTSEQTWRLDVMKSRLGLSSLEYAFEQMSQSPKNVLSYGTEMLKFANGVLQSFNDQVEQAFEEENEEENDYPAWDVLTTYNGLLDNVENNVRRLEKLIQKQPLYSSDTDDQLDELLRRTRIFFENLMDAKSRSLDPQDGDVLG